MLAKWSETEQKIIDLIESQDDVALDELYERTKKEYYAGNKKLSFVFNRIVVERIKRTQKAIQEL